MGVRIKMRRGACARPARHNEAMNVSVTDIAKEQEAQRPARGGWGERAGPRLFYAPAGNPTPPYGVQADERD